jgi:archaellum component FlaC
MDIEHEIHELKRRVGDLEGAVNVLSGKVGSVQPDLMALKDLSVKRFNTIDDTMDRFDKRLEKVNSLVWGLRDDLPELLGAAVSRAISRGGN